MAAPVIDSVSPSGPLTAPVGGTITITVAAHDPDSRTEAVTITVTDSQGNVSGPSVVTVVWSDPLKYGATVPAGSVTKVSSAGNVITLQG